MSNNISQASISADSIHQAYNSREQEKINKNMDKTKHIIDYLKSEGLILHRIIIGIGTYRQINAITNFLKDKLSKETEEKKATIVLNIDGHFNSEIIKEELKSQRTMVQSHGEPDNPRFPLEKVKNQPLYRFGTSLGFLAFISQDIDTKYFDKLHDIHKQKTVINIGIPRLAQACMPAINTYVNILLKILTENHFNELYIFNDANWNNVDQTLKIMYNGNIVFENFCEILYVLDKADADKKFFIDRFSKELYMFNKRPVQKTEDNSYIFEYTHDLTFDKKAGSHRENSNPLLISTSRSSGLGAGAGNDQASGRGAGSGQGGGRRTTTRKQKKRSRRNRR